MIGQAITLAEGKPPLGGPPRFRQSRQSTVKHRKIEDTTEVASFYARQADSAFSQVTGLSPLEVTWTS